MHALFGQNTSRGLFCAEARALAVRLLGGQWIATQGGVNDVSGAMRDVLASLWIEHVRPCAEATLHDDVETSNEGKLAWMHSPRWLHEEEAAHMRDVSFAAFGELALEVCCAVRVPICLESLL